MCLEFILLSCVFSQFSTQGLLIGFSVAALTNNKYKLTFTGKGKLVYSLFII